MGINLKTLLVLSCFVSSAYGESIRLTYPDGAKALITTEIATEVEIKIGNDEPLHAKGLETTKAEVRIVSLEKEAKAFPLNISYTLKDYVSELEQEGSKSKYSIDTPKMDFLYSEMQALKNNPVALVLNGQEFGFIPKNEHNIYAEIIKSKKVAGLLLNRLREPFFLFGRTLTVGKVIEIPIEIDEIKERKGKLSYKVTAITADKIQADITLSLPRQRMQDTILIVSSGNANGKGEFSRKNPLDFSIVMEGHFGSSMKMENGEVESQEYDLKLRITGAPS